MYLFRTPRKQTSVVFTALSEFFECVAPTRLLINLFDLLDIRRVSDKLSGELGKIYGKINHSG
jgi:hypothetical protein